MSPDAALLVQVGTALYGPSWQAPVAAVLGRTPQSVSNMAAGRQGIRPEYWAALLAAGGAYVVARTLDDVAFALAGWGVPLRCRLLPFLAADAVRAVRRRRAA